MSALVVAEHVRRTFAGGASSVHALRGVSLELTAGEMVALVGRSGSGRTGLLNIVGGLDRPDRILPAVRGLGRRHARYGVEPDHYATVASALIWALGQGLGPEFTPAPRRAWIDAYSLLAWTMIAAAEDELRDQAA